MSDSRPIGTVTFQVHARTVLKSLLASDDLPLIMDWEYLETHADEVSVSATTSNFGRIVTLTIEGGE